MKKIPGLLVILSLSLSGIAQIPSNSPTSGTTDKFATLLANIDRQYVDSVDLEELTEMAIVSMLQQLDPHSVYMSKEEMQEANEPLQGSFEGVGIQFQILRDTIYVVTPIVGGPSEKLGIMSGDKIVEVEGKSVAGIGITNKDVLDKLRGAKGTTVNVGILRQSIKEIAHYAIIRDKIPIFSIDASYMASPEIGYIKVSRFAKTTMEELHAELSELLQLGMKDLILDLQGNGGGLLNSAIEMADEFLGGDKLLVYTEGRSFPKEEFKARITGMFEKGRLIVLVDEGSASASEIVSGAVQDWDRGLIIGRRSFGKGLVQRPVYLPDGSAVRLTVQKYYTPSGRCIQKPYEEGVEEYSKEKYERFLNGEAFHADSIHVPDSLKFYTNVKKRIVYGGGGIIPDVFVALDTTQSSKYFSDLLRTNVQNNYVLNYVDRNRTTLKAQYPTLDQFVAGYSVTEQMMTELIAEAEKEKVVYNEAQFKTSESWIRLRMKALIARNLYDSAAFYQIINELNPAYKKALEVLKDGTFDKMKLAYSEFK